MSYNNINSSFIANGTVMICNLCRAQNFNREDIVLMNGLVFVNYQKTTLCCVPTHDQLSGHIPLLGTWH